MAAWEGGAKKDPAAAAAPTFDAGHGVLSGVQPFGGQGSMGTGGGDLSPQGLSGRGSGGGRDRAFDAPAPPPGGGLDNAFDDAPATPPGGGLDNAFDDAPAPPPGGGLDNAFHDADAPGLGCGGGEALGSPDVGRLMRPLLGAEHVGCADRGGMMMRRLAVLFLLLGAMTLTGEGEPDAPWHNQIGGLMAWLVGCILLFLSSLQ
ncbi:unnamed protein product [Urochloa humidicola]